MSLRSGFTLAPSEWDPQGCLGTFLLQTPRKSTEQAYKKRGLDFISSFGATISRP